MKKAELTKIIKFIESEIHGYDIDFDYEIENETVTVKLNGSFTNNQTIEIEFSLSELDREIHFYSISECWSIAETREFWIDFMARIYQ